MYDKLYQSRVLKTRFNDHHLGIATNIVKIDTFIHNTINTFVSIIYTSTPIIPAVSASLKNYIFIVLVQVFPMKHCEFFLL